MTAPDRATWRISPRVAAAIVALLFALEATDAMAAVRARLDHAATMWWRGLERRERGTFRRAALARVLRAPRQSGGTSVIPGG